jgi:hypothetical protein
MNQLSGLIASPVALSNPKLINTSSRAMVTSGNGVQIVGFVIDGTENKTVLVRAAGPALSNFGITDALADPVMDVYNARGVRVGGNDNWGDDANSVSAIESAVSRAGAWSWTRGTKDSAALLSLAPGAYTVVVRGVGNLTGVSLVEVYDAVLN